MKSTTKILVLILCFGAMSGLAWGHSEFGDFRTRKSGSWHDPTVWEKYLPPGLWLPVIDPPSGKDGLITILPTHKIHITSPFVYVDTLVVSGELYVHNYFLAVRDSLAVNVSSGDNGSVLGLLEGGNIGNWGGPKIPDKARCLIVGLLQVLQRKIL